MYLGDAIARRHPLSGITRAPSATPAGGSHRRHKQEQAEIISRAFDEEAEARKTGSTK